MAFAIFFRVATSWVPLNLHFSASRSYEMHFDFDAAFFHLPFNSFVLWRLWLKFVRFGVISRMHTGNLTKTPRETLFHSISKLIHFNWLILIRWCVVLAESTSFGFRKCYEINIFTDANTVYTSCFSANEYCQTECIDIHFFQRFLLSLIIERK